MNAILKAADYLATLGIGGLGCALTAKAMRTTQRLKVRRPDCRHPFWLRVPSTDVPVFKQIFVERHYDFRVAKPPEIIVDAGANIGLASIWFANRYPDARIIALEPEQSNFELLRANVGPYPQIVPVQAALWHRNEEIRLIDPGLGKWGFMAEAQPAAGDLRGDLCDTVTAVTVDRLMADHGLRRIDLFKIDIEGAEREVFSDAASWICRVDAIVIELHERMKPGCNRAFYGGSGGFDDEWQQGENICLSRGGRLARR